MKKNINKQTKEFNKILENNNKSQKKDNYDDDFYDLKAILKRYIFLYNNSITNLEKEKNSFVIEIILFSIFSLPLSLMLDKFFIVGFLIYIILLSEKIKNFYNTKKYLQSLIQKRDEYKLELDKYISNQEKSSSIDKKIEMMKDECNEISKNKSDNYSYKGQNNLFVQNEEVSIEDIFCFSNNSSRNKIKIR